MPSPGVLRESDARASLVRHWVVQFVPETIGVIPTGVVGKHVLGAARGSQGSGYPKVQYFI